MGLFLPGPALRYVHKPHPDNVEDPPAETETLVMDHDPGAIPRVDEWAQIDDEWYIVHRVIHRVDEDVVEVLVETASETATRRGETRRRLRAASLDPGVRDE